MMVNVKIAKYVAMMMKFAELYKGEPHANNDSEEPCFSEWVRTRILFNVFSFLFFVLVPIHAAVSEGMLFLAKFDS